MFQSKFTTFVSGLLLAGSVFAGQQSICPDINDIKAEGMVMAEEILFNQYITYNTSHYNTESNWSFFIAPLEAESTDEALESANDVLSTMNAPGIPQNDKMNFMCQYSTGDTHLIAMAVRNDFLMTPMQLKQQFNAIY